MAKFSIEHLTALNPADAFEKIKSFISQGQDLKKFDDKITYDFDEQSKQCAIKGSQFKAQLDVQASKEGSKITIAVDLPFVFLAFKGKIQDSLTKMLSRHLG